MTNHNCKNLPDTLVGQCKNLLIYHNTDSTFDALHVHVVNNIVDRIFECKSFTCHGVILLFCTGNFT